MIKINRHPGAVLREDFHEKTGRTAAELARAIGMSPHSVRNTLNELQGISKNMAERLAKEFGTTVDFWVDMQNNYKVFTRK
jgi:addiction module HigA family antidote